MGEHSFLSQRETSNRRYVTYVVFLSIRQNTAMYTKSYS